MRLAFWRTGDDKARVQRAASKPAPATYNSTGAGLAENLDLRTLGKGLVRNRDWIIVPTVLAALLSIAAANLVTPRYKSEARILIDGSENVLLRPNGERNEERIALDSEAVTSQVQLLLSRDLAREIIKKNKLGERPEFDPMLQSPSPLKSLLALFGIGRDPLSPTPEERVLDAYFDRITAYAIDKSPVIVVEFQSHDPELAARVANSIAEGYLVLPQNARPEQTQSASQWLSGEIENLRKKVGALEREAKAQRDLLQSYLAKYREANIRENMGAAPAHGRIISHATVSNTPVYPKTLPIVLIATLATLILSAGAIASGELLRMTAPRAPAAFSSSPVPAPALPPQVATVAATVATASAPAPDFGETRTEIVPGLTEIEQLAENLHGAGEAARKITILGTAAGESITLTALTLARLIARHAKVVVVDLSASSPMISAVSVDPAAPGLAELMLGQASFSHVITKDRLSRVHLVSAGRPGLDRTLLQSPRLTLAIDALLRVYDHVLLHAGSASDLSAEMLTAQARAVVVPDASMADDARTLMCDQFKAVGFAEVTMLSKRSEPLNALEPGPRAAAA
ncbi:MAG TPA: Wzz/FepE/Etk N-terminal domain-containing protein [Bradyrhizobium sp.]